MEFVSQKTRWLVRGKRDWQKMCNKISQIEEETYGTNNNVFGSIAEWPEPGESQATVTASSWLGCKWSSCGEVLSVALEARCQEALQVSPPQSWQDSSTTQVDVPCRDAAFSRRDFGVLKNLKAVNVILLNVSKQESLVMILLFQLRDFEQH